MTAGGQHSNAISFDTEPNEMPLIREGCAMRALTFLDQQIFAPGHRRRQLWRRQARRLILELATSATHCRAGLPRSST